MTELIAAAESSNAGIMSWGFGDSVVMTESVCDDKICYKLL